VREKLPLLVDLYQLHQAVERSMDEEREAVLEEIAECPVGLQQEAEARNLHSTAVEESEKADVYEHRVGDLRE
jgi:hypothetical protein